MARDHYAALEVPPHATQEEIKKAHRRLARQYHPDTRKTEAARERFYRVQEAYEVLSDPKKRAQYDRQRRGHGVAAYRQNQAAAERQSPQPAKGAPQAAPPRRRETPLARAKKILREAAAKVRRLVKRRR